MKVAIVIFSGPEQEALFRLFQRHHQRWWGCVDQTVIVDSGAGLDNLGAKRMLNTSYIQRHMDSHWGNMNYVLREVITGDDQVALFDSDMLIYNALAIDTGFHLLSQGFHAGGIFDTSGEHDLSYHQVMQENDNRTDRRRLCPYLCFFHRRVLTDGFDFTAKDGYDSMGRITHQLLDDGCRLFEFADDRSSIYLEDGGRITSTQWLENPPKLWSVENPDLGYYHLRNYGGAMRLLSTYGVDPLNHRTHLEAMPRREALRVLSWAHIVHELVGYDTRPVDIVAFQLCEATVWEHYLDSVWDYYPWLRLLYD